MLERFESAFAAAGVPYQVRGSERFYERPEVRQAVMLLRGALRGRADGEQPWRPSAEVRNVLSGLGLTPAQPAWAVVPAGSGGSHWRPSRSSLTTCTPPVRTPRWRTSPPS